MVVQYATDGGHSCFCAGVPRRTAAQVLAILLALAACGQPARPTLDDSAGTTEPSAAAAAGDISAGAGDGVPPTTTDPSAPGVTEPGAATGSGAPAPSAADVLGAYFDALQAEDFATAQQVSTGSAQLMARIRDLVARYNSEREGTAELTYSERSFRVGSNDPARITYVGAARLDSTVSGPAGDPYTESALFENPVVSLVDGRWRVADFTYDGRPLERHPAASSQAIGGVALHLAGALDFGTSTGLIVDLVPDADHAIKVDGVELRYADGTTATPNLSALVGEEPSGLYFLFDRSEAQPVAWAATVTIDEGTSTEISDDVVLRF